jgi:hypothetical protein
VSPRERKRPSATSGVALKASPESLMPAPAVAAVAPPSTAPVAAEQPGEKEPLVYLSARVPKSLRTELQVYAAQNDKSVAELVQVAVRALLDAHKST